MIKRIALACAVSCSLVMAGCGAGKPRVSPGAWATPATRPVHAAAEARSLPPSSDPAIPAGSVLLRKYPGGYTAFKLQSADGRIVIMDPFGMDERVKPDAVSVSHDHLDHCDFSMIDAGGAMARQPGTVSANGIVLRGFAGVHNSGDAAVTNVMRLIEMDGLKILHLASQAAVPDMETMKAIGPVDVLILQVFLPGNRKLLTQDAVGIAKALKARVVVPAHGDARLNADFAKALGAELRKAPSGRLIIKRAAPGSSEPPAVIDMDNPAAD